MVDTNIPSLEELLREYNNKISNFPERGDFSKEAQNVKEMYAVLQQFPERPGSIRTILKRMRTSRSWEYGVLSVFPEGFNRFDDDGPVVPSFVAYLKVQTSCVSHASDLLYKSLRDSDQTMAYMPFMNQTEYEAKVSKGRHFIEFMDRATGKTQDPLDFMRAAVQGYFSNEKRLIIPEPLLR